MRACETRLGHKKVSFRNAPLQCALWRASRAEVPHSVPASIAAIFFRESTHDCAREADSY